MTVFVDLNVASSRSAIGASGGGGEVIDNTAAAKKHDASQLEEYDEKLDQLTDEWDKLWKELETLHPEIVSSDDSKSDDENKEDDGSSSVWDHGQREVAAICANFIDLTQTKSDDNHDDDDDSPSQLPISSLQTSRDKQMKKKALQQREEATHTILRRLKQLHCEIMELQLEMKNQPSLSSCANITTQQTQKLRSKVIKLQSKNADLTSQLQSLQSEFDNQEDKMESFQTMLTERTVETEMQKRNAEKIYSEFQLMEESYQKHVSKSNMEQTALKSDIRRLQDQITKLSSQSGLQDLQEMEEIRRKYSKMSQDVHSLRSENTRLAKRLEDERAVWRRELGREKAKYQQQMGLTTRQSKDSEEVDGGDADWSWSGSSSHREKSGKSRKLFSLDGRRRDQQAILSTKKTAAVAATTFGLAAMPASRPKSKDKPPNKSKAMDILDSTRSRKHSLQRNSLMMSVKRAKTTSFAKAKAPRK